MQSFLAVGNRREFLKLSGTIGFGLVGITLVSWPTGVAARSDQLPGFDPGKANRDQIEKWTGLAVNSVNSILAGTATRSPILTPLRTLIEIACSIWTNSVSMRQEQNTLSRTRTCPSPPSGVLQTGTSK